MKFLVKCGGDGIPMRRQTEFQPDQNFAIEIPGNIGILQESQLDCAAQWRQITREAFLQAFEAGFFVTGFRRRQGTSGPLGAYILTSAPSD